MRWHQGKGEEELKLLDSPQTPHIFCLTDDWRQHPWQQPSFYVLSPVQAAYYFKPTLIYFFLYSNNRVQNVWV